MGRTSHSNYVEAARQVLDELGGGPMSSRDLVAAAQERGLVGTGTWVYHNFLRKVRETEDFDTSRRGYVSLAGDGSTVVEADRPGDTDPILEEAAIPGTDPLMDPVQSVETSAGIPGTNPILEQEQNMEVDEDNPFESTA